MLRRLHRLLLAVIAVVMCLAVIGPFRELAAVRASIAMTHDIARTRWSGVGTDGSHRSADIAPDTSVDLEAIETERDEEDDAPCDLADETTFALTCAPQRPLLRPHLVELSSDTSRRHHHTIFARGPPA
jgi:hypothetical protein